MHLKCIILPFLSLLLEDFGSETCLLHSFTGSTVEFSVSVPDLFVLEYAVLRTYAFLETGNVESPFYKISLEVDGLLIFQTSATLLVRHNFAGWWKAHARFEGFKHL